MSELKVYHCNEWHNEYTEFYLKSDVDKVIVEKDEKIDELEEHIDELQKATDSAWSKVNSMYDELTHNERKRCLAMAEMCNANYFRQYMFKPNFWKQWHKRWLELAEKFKEAK